ncbi:MAG: hypothetical protein J6P56_02430, partial [Bacteroidales bacterium]|nr:hypothetical protein [Bacteroidales bacterium]
MKRILLLLWVLGLAVLPLSAQTLKKTFTGTLECMRYIPAYEDGKVFYVNPHAGGQSGNLVVLKEADGQYRIWDNDSRMWFSESIEDCKSLFFINVDMVFVAKKSDRCRVMYTGMLDGLKLEDRNMMFTDWRYKLNEQRQIEYLVLALGQKWGVMGPDGNFLVPTRYDSPEEALSALKKRKEAEKPLGMSDMAFMASQIHDITHRDEMFDGAVHLDWQWYDPVNGTLYYTLEELPWCGP